MVTYIDDTAYIEIPGGMDLEFTFQCGQAFRWAMADDGSCTGIAGGRRVTMRNTTDGISITPCTHDDFESFWHYYLDLDTDYTVMEARLAQDSVLAPVVACCRGMRILNQPVWECLASFLLSSNNNVKRISNIVERLSTAFGQDCGGYYDFPTAQALFEAGEAAIRSCGAGYRAAFLWQAAQAVCAGFPLAELPHMGYEQARAKLIELYGIGEKVADCILLFCCGYGQAFPVDVWVKRAMAKYFPQSGTKAIQQREYAQQRFGPLAGLAQQLLFHYERKYIRELTNQNSNQFRSRDILPIMKKSMEG